MPVSISGDGAITGLELEAFEDVDVGSGASDGDVLTYDASGDLWIPQGIVPIAGIGSNVVSVVRTAILSTSSTTYQNFLTATITPSSATSKVLFILFAPVGVQQALHAAQIRLRREGSDLFTPDSPGDRTASPFMLEGFAGCNPLMQVAHFTFLDSPATTSATTYTADIRSNTGAGTVYINRTHQDTNAATFSRGVATLTLVEVAA
jgi:hypothetical protein